MSKNSKTITETSGNKLDPNAKESKKHHPDLKKEWPMNEL